MAWTRTSFAFLANGALLTVRNLHSGEGPGRLIPAVLAACAASFTYLVALRRQRTLEQRPLPARISPRRQVYAIGVVTMVVILVTLVAQLS
jgi:uncharacterized membrane protein YidH (DUF202 family)